MDKKDIEEELRKLAQGYLTKLPDLLRDIAQNWESLTDKKWDKQQLDKLKLLCHSISGAGGTFGMPDIGILASNAEQLLKQVSGDKRPSDSVIKELNNAINEVIDYRVDIAESAQITMLSSVSLGPLAQCPIYLINNNENLTKSLTIQLCAYDYQVESFSSLADAEIAISKKMPGAIIWDMMFPEDSLAGADWISTIRDRYLRDIPVVFISVHEDFSSRLKAVRMGGSAYFVKPFDIVELVNHLDILVAKNRNDPYRVLIIDDDIFLSSHYANLLEAAKIATRTINNPLEVMEALIELNPDLLLMDMHMPECNGLELAEALRQHSAYSHIPIIFLSGEKDIAQQFLARAVGADDYLLKPIEDRHLISTVINRAQRARSIGSKISYDGMTGLLTHEKLIAECKRQITLFKRQDTKICFCMCDLDDFKSINDKYGHLTGDTVLKRLSTLFKNRLRRSDIIARFGGDEFAFILPDIEIDDAFVVLDSLREEFAAMTHTASDAQFTTTISIGITPFLPTDQKPQEIINRADQALYEIKQTGRNRVLAKLQS